MAASKAVKIVVEGDREANRAFLQEHRLNLDDVYCLLEILEVEDYSEGPNPDDKKRPCVVWIFGPDFCSNPIYVKIADWKPSKARFHCVSFHDAKYPLALPYRK